MMQLALFSLLLPLAAYSGIAPEECQGTYGRLGKPLPNYWAMPEKQRWSEIEKILGVPLESGQKNCLWDIHLIGAGKPGKKKNFPLPAMHYNYTFAQLREKRQKLIKKCGFTASRADLLLRAGVVGFGDVLEALAEGQRFAAKVSQVESALSGDVSGVLRARAVENVLDGEYGRAINDEIAANAIDAWSGGGSSVARAASSSASSPTRALTEAEIQAAKVAAAKAAAEAAQREFWAAEKLKPVFADWQAGRTLAAPDNVFDNTYLYTEDTRAYIRDGKQRLFRVRGENGGWREFVGKVVDYDQIRDGFYVGIETKNGMVTVENNRLQAMSIPLEKVGLPADLQTPLERAMASLQAGKTEEARMPASSLSYIRYGEAQDYIKDAKTRVFQVSENADGSGSSRQLVGKLVRADKPPLMQRVDTPTEEGTPKRFVVQLASGETVEVSGQQAQTARVMETPVEDFSKPLSTRMTDIEQYAQGEMLRTQLQNRLKKPEQLKDLVEGWQFGKNDLPDEAFDYFFNEHRGLDPLVDGKHRLFRVRRPNGSTEEVIATVAKSKDSYYAHLVTTSGKKIFPEDMIRGTVASFEDMGLAGSLQTRMDRVFTQIEAQGMKGDLSMPLPRDEFGLANFGAVKEFQADGKLRIFQFPGANGSRNVLAKVVEADKPPMMDRVFSGTEESMPKRVVLELGTGQKVELTKDQAFHLKVIDTPFSGGN